MNSSRKGSRGELELLHLLEGQGLACHRNDQRYIGGKNNPDISLIINGQRYHVECKRKERLNLHEAYAQAVGDVSSDSVPVVIHRRSREPWMITLSLSDFLKGLKHEYTEPEAKAIHDRLNLWADRLEDDVNSVKALISSIPDPIDRELFRMRYIKGDTWAKIECTLPYCRAQLYKRHRKQLDCWRDAGLLTK